MGNEKRRFFLCRKIRHHFNRVNEFGKNLNPGGVRDEGWVVSCELKRQEMLVPKESYQLF